MERYTVKTSAADTTDMSFSLDSSKARKIFTLNTHEEKRLEKVCWNLEKQRLAETKRFLKAQKDTIARHFASRKVHSAGKVDVGEKVLQRNSAWTPLTEQELLSSISSSHSDPQCLISEKNNIKCKRKLSQQVVMDYKSTASVSYSVLPHMRRLSLVSEGNLVQWFRSWSSRARPKFRFLWNKVDNDKETTKRSNSSKQKTFIHENSKDEIESENEGKERCLAEILPPISLPPLHLQKQKTLKEKRETSTAKEKVKNEKLWEGLKDCRYIRTYVKNK